MRGTALLLVLIITTILTAALWPASAQEHQLELEVVDAKGRPVSAVELVLLDGTIRRAFRTTEDGLAVFRALPSGTYVAQLQIDGVLVLNETLTVPQQGRLRLVARVASATVAVLDSDGLPLRGATIRLTSNSGRVVREGITGELGTVALSNLPLSELGSVGTYNVSIRVQRLTVNIGTLHHDVSKDRHEFVGPFATVRMKLVDLMGNPIPDGRVTISTGQLSYQASVSEGLTEFRGVVTSDVAGLYELSVVRLFGRNRVNVTLLTSTLELVRTSNVTLVVNALDLEVRVLADGIDPVVGVRVTVSSTVGELGTNSTDSSGSARFRALPASNVAGVGEMTLRLTLGGRSLLNSTHRLTTDSSLTSISVPRKEFNVKLLSADGSPLAGAQVRTTDPGTGKPMNSTTDSAGIARLRVLPVRFRISVIYEGHLLQTAEVDPMRQEIELRVLNARIPVTLDVRDWFGARSQGISLKVSQAGREVQVTRTDGAFSFIAPVRGPLTVEVFLDDRLIAKRVIVVTSPSRETITISGFFIGGGLVGPDVMGLVVSSAVAASMIAGGLLLFMRTRRPTKEFHARA